jgi:hypothetical protein
MQRECAKPWGAGWFTRGTAAYYFTGRGEGEALISLMKRRTYIVKNDHSIVSVIFDSRYVRSFATKMYKFPPAEPGRELRGKRAK